ncbi:MAG: SDR family oxidoreductase, partial [Deltaproteobacteria bacterium]|nr:SDR family oxidoreductase [Deltaproteobacteria bacterium]
MTDQNPKVALIAGGLGGVGLAAAKRLAQEGLKVIASDADQGSVQAAKDELTRLGVKVVSSDLTQAAGVTSLINQTLEEGGRLDILVANSRMAPSGGILDTEAPVFDQGMAVNVKAAFLLCQESARAMAGSGGGCIVLVAEGLNDGDEDNDLLSLVGDASCGALERMA